MRFHLSLVSCNLKEQIEDIYSFPKDVRFQVCRLTEDGSAPLTHLWICVCRTSNIGGFRPSALVSLVWAANICSWKTPRNFTAGYPTGMSRWQATLSGRSTTASFFQWLYPEIESSNITKKKRLMSSTKSLVNLALLPMSDLWFPFIFESLKPKRPFMLNPFTGVRAQFVHWFPFSNAADTVRRLFFNFLHSTVIYSTLKVN